MGPEILSLNLGLKTGPEILSNLSLELGPEIAISTSIFSLNVLVQYHSK